MKENKSNIIIIVVAVLLSFVSGTVGSYLVITNVPSITKKVVENVSKSEYTENSIADSVDKVKNAVVVVMSYKNNMQISTGTGFVYKKDGDTSYIMTNNHVIESADKVQLILEDGSTIEASIVGGETYSDIAVLTSKSEKLNTVIEIGDSSQSRLGDTVFTVGSPMGEEYRGTVTKGTLSGKDRLVAVSFSGTTSDYYMKVLQTDAAINPGNSGGPLLNINGEVIGVNSLKLVKDEIEGMGFAIPIEDALNYAETLENGDTVERPYIGIGMLDITDQYYLWQNGITVPNNITQGVAILSVELGSPAQSANIQKGDIIIKINDTDISSVAEFRYELYKYNAKDTINITYIRDGKEHTTKVTLASQ